VRLDHLLSGNTAVKFERSHLSVVGRLSPTAWVRAWSQATGSGL
jgi:hypothetical protein